MEELMGNMNDLHEQANTRATILRNARDLFLSQGYYNTTMRAIAQVSGISTGPLYFHFRNKAEVFYHICSQAYDQLTNDFKQAAATEERPASRLRAIYLAYQAFYYREPQFFEIMHLAKNPLAGIDLPEELSASLQEKTKELIGLMENIIKEGISQGELRSINPKKLALYLYSSAEGVFFLGRSGLLAQAGVELDDMIATAIVLIGQGMREVDVSGDRCLP
jgi:AcrR family transcriptional regulator